MSLTYYESQATAHAILNRPHSRCECFFLCTKCFLTIGFAFFRYSVQHAWVLTLFVNAAGWSVLFIYFFYLPYYRLPMNQLKVGFLSANAYACLLCIVNVASPAVSRLDLFIALCVGVPTTFVMGFFGTKKWFQFICGRTSDKLWSPAHYEIATRQYVQKIDPSEHDKTMAEDVFKQAEKKFSQSSLLLMMYANFLGSYFPNSGQDHGLIYRTKSLDPAFDVRFYIYKFEKEKDRAENSTAMGEKNMGLIAYIEFQKEQRETTKHHKMALKVLAKFWRVLLQETVEIEEMDRISRHIEVAEHRARVNYKRLLSKHPNSPQILYSYGDFLLKVANDPIQAEALIKQSFELQEQAATAQIAEVEQDLEEFDDAQIGQMKSHEDEGGLIDLNSRVCCINETGKIIFANDALCSMFGYSKDHIQGQNISMLMPEPYSSQHNRMLELYKRTQVGPVINTTRVVFCINSSGYFFPAELSVSKLDQDKSVMFSGMIKPLTDKVPSLLVDQTWTITSVNLSFVTAFGLNRGAVLKKPLVTIITTLKPDSSGQIVLPWDTDHDGSVMTASGDTEPVSFRIKELREKVGRVYLVQLTQKEPTEVKKKQKKKSLSFREDLEDSDSPVVSTPRSAASSSPMTPTPTSPPADNIPLGGCFPGTDIELGGCPFLPPKNQRGARGSPPPSALKTPSDDELAEMEPATQDPRSSPDSLPPTPSSQKKSPRAKGGVQFAEADDVAPDKPMKRPSSDSAPPIQPPEEEFTPETRDIPHAKGPGSVGGASGVSGNSMTMPEPDDKTKLFKSSAERVRWRKMRAKLMKKADLNNLGVMRLQRFASAFILFLLVVLIAFISAHQGLLGTFSKNFVLVSSSTDRAVIAHRLNLFTQTKYMADSGLARFVGPMTSAGFDVDFSVDPALATTTQELRTAGVISGNAKGSEGNSSASANTQSVLIDTSGMSTSGATCATSGYPLVAEFRKHHQEMYLNATQSSQIKDSLYRHDDIQLNLYLLNTTDTYMPSSYELLSLWEAGLKVMRKVENYLKPVSQCTSGPPLPKRPKIFEQADALFIMRNLPLTLGSALVSSTESYISAWDAERWMYINSFTAVMAISFALGAAFEFLVVKPAVHHVFNEKEKIFSIFLKIPRKLVLQLSDIAMKLELERRDEEDEDEADRDAGLTPDHNSQAGSEVVFVPSVPSPSNPSGGLTAAGLATLDHGDGPDDIERVENYFESNFYDQQVADMMMGGGGPMGMGPPGTFYSPADEAVLDMHNLDMFTFGGEVLDPNEEFTTKSTQFYYDENGIPVPYIVSQPWQPELDQYPISSPHMDDSGYFLPDSQYMDTMMSSYSLRPPAAVPFHNLTDEGMIGELMSLAHQLPPLPPTPPSPKDDLQEDPPGVLRRPPSVFQEVQDSDQTPVKVQPKQGRRTTTPTPTNAKRSKKRKLSGRSASITTPFMIKTFLSLFVFTALLVMWIYLLTAQNTSEHTNSLKQIHLAGERLVHADTLRFYLRRYMSEPEKYSELKHLVRERHTALQDVHKQLLFSTHDSQVALARKRDAVQDELLFGTPCLLYNGNCTMSDPVQTRQGLHNLIIEYLTQIDDILRPNSVPAPDTPAFQKAEFQLSLFLSEGLALSLDAYKSDATTLAKSSEPGYLLMFLGAIILLILEWFVVYRPLIHFLQKETHRLTKLLLLTPHNVVESVPAIRQFLMAADKK